MVEQTNPGEGGGLELVVLVDQPLENAGGVDFMGRTVGLIFFVEDDAVVDDRDVDFHLSFVYGLYCVFFLFGKTYLEDIFPHL